MSARLATLLAPLFLLASACDDPVKDADVAALGPEDPNVPIGPLHRPGQPCIVCHGGSGPGVLQMSIAGTIYEQSHSSKPAAGAIVNLTDASGEVHQAETNCAGNFFVESVDWSPTFPVHTAIAYHASEAKMTARIGREGSCAACHTGVDGPGSLIHVYLSDDPTVVIGSGASCR
jgi:hypothetical protein